MVPFHRGRDALACVVAAVVASACVREIIVVANGRSEDITDVSSLPLVRILDLPEACGPAIARNRGAEAAAGSILVFVDADVIPHATAIPMMVRRLSDDRGLAGLFGAYDHAPADPSFFSQYRNLAHAFVHEQGNPEARTFWAGLGAIRQSAFASIGGFDERFREPSIEDIDLGYRLGKQGYRLRLDTSIRGQHLKRWTPVSAIVIDVKHRGVPWTQALLKYRALENDLNVSWKDRAAVALVYLTIASAVATPGFPPGAIVAVTALSGFAATQWPLIRWFRELRGPRFAVGVLAGQFLHHLCNGVSFVIGVGLWTVQRIFGWRAAWTLPPDPWRVSGR